jgi:Zinc finger, C3HC4 type (RING finger)
VSVLESQISQLKNQVASQKKQLDKQSSLASHFQSSLTCQICIDLMYKPYALSPCGHLACYDCLVRWFKTPASGSSHPEDENENVHKRKTCPHCRAVLRERPIEIYSIKDMVHALDKSGLTTGLPSHEDSPPTAGDVADPWKGIFPKQSIHRRRDRFLPPFIHEELADMGVWHRADLDSDDDHEGVVDEFMGIYDEEDEIYRCNDCLHEIWDGVCSSCGRIYAPFNEPVDLDGIGNNSDGTRRRPRGTRRRGDGPGLAHMTFMNQAMQLGMMFLPPPLGYMRDIDIDHAAEGVNESDVNPIIEELEDEEEEGYESSFIDDEDSEGIRAALRTVRQVLDVTSDDESSDVITASRQIIRPNSHRPTRSAPSRFPQSSRVRRRREILSEDEETIGNNHP